MKFFYKAGQSLGSGSTRVADRILSPRSQYSSKQKDQEAGLQELAGVPVSDRVLERNGHHVREKTGHGLM